MQSRRRTRFAVARPLEIAGAVVVLMVAAGAGTGSYTVRRGDTLSTIARKLGVPLAALADANDIQDRDRIHEGRVLRVPDRSRTSEVIHIASVRPARQPALHRVQRGESLTSIARRYGTDIETIAKLNGIRDRDRVRYGTKLRLPVGTAAESRQERPLCPVRGASRFDIASNFGAPRAGRQHQGNDIFARRGAPVVAPVDGTLRRADGRRAGKAFYLEAVNGTMLYGAHLGAIVVDAGPVARGTVIGHVGTSGNARRTPPHLHFEIHPDGRAAINPYATLRRWCR